MKNVPQNTIHVQNQLKRQNSRAIHESREKMDNELIRNVYNVVKRIHDFHAQF